MKIITNMLVRYRQSIKGVKTKVLILKNYVIVIYLNSLITCLPGVNEMFYFLTYKSTKSCLGTGNNLKI